MNKKITVLVDNDSWILPCAEELVVKLITLGYKACLAREHDEVTRGWINFMLGCVKIMPSDILKRNKHNLVAHESDLPIGKGFAPMTWQILEGKGEIPICLIEATSKVDAGDLYLKDTIKLDGTELNTEWRHKQGLKTLELCLKFVKNYDNLTPVLQEGESTFFKKRTQTDSELDINKSIKDQFNLLRVVDNKNYPAFFYINNCKYILKIEKE